MSSRRNFLKATLPIVPAITVAPAVMPSDNRQADEAEFIQLFDGKTLEGWHLNPQKIGHGTGGRWVVEDDAIVGEQEKQVARY